MIAPFQRSYSNARIQGGHLDRGPAERHTFPAPLPRRAQAPLQCRRHPDTAAPHRSLYKVKKGQEKL